MSRASVSIGTRLLAANGLVRRSVAPGARSHRYEIDPQAFAAIPAAQIYGEWRRVAERGLALLDDADGERGARLRETRDFFHFVEREVPPLIGRYFAERQRVSPGG